MHEGMHLLTDRLYDTREPGLGHRALPNAMAGAAEALGTAVTFLIRYESGQQSTPGRAAVVGLDESRCSVHTYADPGLVAKDVFTGRDIVPGTARQEVGPGLDLEAATVEQETGCQIEDAPLVRGQGRPEAHWN